MKFLFFYLSLALSQGLYAAENSLQITVTKPVREPGPPPQLGIAAVVNNEVITVADLEDRLRLVILSSGMPYTPETRAQLKSTVLRTLIDERLQLIELKKAELEIPKEAIEEAFENLERQNNSPRGSLDTFLKENAIPRHTLEEQARAQIGWVELIKNQFGPTLQISEREIDAEFARKRQTVDQPVYLLSEIFLSLDGANDKEIAERANNLFEMLANRQANFGALANQVSQAASAATGGDIGWVQGDSLSPEIRALLDKVPAGAILRPIRTSKGYYIYALRGREISALRSDQQVVDLKQVRVDLPPDASNAVGKEKLAQLDKLRIRAHSCPTLVDFARTMNNMKVRDIKDTALEDLPPKLAETLKDLPEGQLTPTVIEGNSLLAFMICQRQVRDAEESQRHEIQETLRRQKLTQISARLLRDLRRNAYIDIRV